MKYHKRNIQTEDLWLLSPEEYNQLPDGTVLSTKQLFHVTKGGLISLTLFDGHYSFGLTQGMAEAQGLLDKFIWWRLASDDPS